MSHLIYQLLALLILTFQKILRENMETDSGHDTIYNQVGEMIGSVADNVNSFGLPKDDVASLIDMIFLAFFLVYTKTLRWHLMKNSTQML